MYPVDLLKVRLACQMPGISTNSLTDQDANNQSIARCNLLWTLQRIRNNYSNRGRTIALAWYDQRNRGSRYGWQFAASIRMNAQCRTRPGPRGLFCDIRSREAGYGGK